jgi:D-alanyl-D-alanine carboxypeptidase (penicillin-binding protein 5/6)
MGMASTTKIMTALVAIENCDLNKIITVSKDAQNQEGSSIYLRAGDQIPLIDLLYGLMLNSGNDAAVAIAEHISKNEEQFALLMNDTAKKLGVKDTNFVNPNGLHDDNHYTTAYELAKITRYALKSDMFREIVSSKMYTATMTLSDGTKTEIEYINHNRLIKEVDGCIGVKTGFTKAAGRCLVSAVDRDGMQYIIVTLNDSDDWNTHKKLYEEIADNSRKKLVVKTGDCMKHIISEKKECSLVAGSDFIVYVENGHGTDFEVIKHVPETIDFPLNAGEKVGYLEIISDDEVIGNVDIIANSDFSPDGEARVHNCFMFTLMNILRNII